MTDELSQLFSVDPLLSKIPMFPGLNSEEAIRLLIKQLKPYVMIRVSKDKRDCHEIFIESTTDVLFPTGNISSFSGIRECIRHDGVYWSNEFSFENKEIFKLNVTNTLLLTNIMLHKLLSQSI